MTRTFIDRDLIQSLADRGLTIPEAVAESGLTDSSLRGAARRFGITFAAAPHGKARWKVSDTRILDMYARGLTTAQAAAECGVSPDHIRKRANVVGVRMGVTTSIKNEHIVAPAPPPKKPKTIAHAMAELARRENAAMREGWQQ